MENLGQIRHVQGSDLKNGEAMTRLVVYFLTRSFA